MRTPLMLALSVCLASIVWGRTPPAFIHEGPGAIDEQTTIVATPPQPFRIAILPDRTTGRDWGLPYLKSAVADLNRMQPDAVFTVGDMVQGYTRDTAEWDRQAAQWQDIVKDLTMPLFPVAGNHDVISGTRIPGDATFGDKYLRTFGPLRYMAELPEATVIAMFSDDGFGNGGVKLSDGQVDWLKTCLQRAKTRGKAIMVIMHRPLWRTASVKWFERVHPALADAGVKLVIAGHFHSMQDDGVRDGVHYDIVGTCGGSIDQHPLAGQMQHLTFVQVQPDGSVQMFHQPAGVTLPVDFVVRADQDAVYALREKPGSLSMTGALPDPQQADAPLEGTVQLQVKNPLDKPITVQARLYTQPEPWMVDGQMFISRTEVDAFNPFTVDQGTRYTMQSVQPVTVKPGESLSLPLHFAWPRATGPVAPPTFEVRETFTDTKGRTVPVFLWMRPAVQRTIALAQSDAKSDAKSDAMPTNTSAWPIHAWVPSPYDTLERDPSVQCWLTADGATLCLRVQVPDQRIAAALEEKRAVDKRMLDPGGDGVAVRWTDAKGTAMLLLEPFTPFQACNREGVQATTESGTDAGGWWAEIRLPLTAGLPTSLNVGVADNDSNYHTQWRWLAPEAAPAKLKAGGNP